MMSRIYRKADDVIFDIGDSDYDSDMAFQLPRKIYNMPGRQKLHSHVERGLRPGELEELGMAPFDHEAWRAWSRLLSRPWFRRVWIVQEIVLARDSTMMCGTFTFIRHFIPRA
jgi:hypothetical protein